jgi:predicted dehydrogenase
MPIWTKEPSKHRKVRYAVIGLGNIAQVAALPAFAHAKENSELVALISSDRAKLSVLSKKYDVAYTGSYDDLEIVLSASKADAVYLAVPNTLHRLITERAAYAGAHVLCEKPMATSVEDCEAMIAATAADGVKLMIAYRLHFEEANLRAIEHIRKGEIGEPRIFSSVFTQQVREADIRTKGSLGGGAVYDMGIYYINAARYLFQSEPIEVMATQIRDTGERFQGVDEVTTAILLFPNNCLAQLTASQGAADVSEYRLVGTRGDVRLDPAYAYTTGLTEFVTVDESTKKRTVARRDQFAAEIIYFSDCILNDRMPEPSGEEGLCDVRVLHAIEESARAGRRMRLAPFERERRPDLSMKIARPAVEKVTPLNAPSPSK